MVVKLLPKLYLIIDICTSVILEVNHILVKLKQKRKSNYITEVKLVTGTIMHMTNEQIFKELQKEENEKEEQKRKQKVKSMMHDILQKMQIQKQKKQEAEDALRILKLDLDDLRSGKIEKIKERHQSQRATKLIPLQDSWFNFQWINFPDYRWWTESTSGTYTVDVNGITKTFYF